MTIDHASLARGGMVRTYPLGVTLITVHQCDTSFVSVRYEAKYPKGSKREFHYFVVDHVVVVPSFRSTVPVQVISDPL